MSEGPEKVQLSQPTIADMDTGEILEIPARVERRNTGLIISDETSFDEWSALGEWLQSAERSLMWWIGDWLRFGESKWGDKYASGIEITGRSYQNLADAKWVADRVEFSRRRENLSWSAHREVAALPPQQADSILDEAEREGWSVRETRAAVHRVKNAARIPAAVAPIEGRKVSDLSALIRNGEKFGCIYADPPWLYDNQGTRAATGNHYEGLTVAQLCELPVNELAADDAHLHLWTTNGFIFECQKIFDAWGFEFRSTFIWCKPQIGIGNYWRNSHEILLTAIRGNAKRFNDHSLRSWIECDRGVHSAKPEIVRHHLEKASPGPRLEMFARSGAEGWTVWGNQIGDTLFDHHQEKVA